MFFLYVNDRNDAMKTWRVIQYVLTKSMLLI